MVTSVGVFICIGVACVSIVVIARVIAVVGAGCICSVGGVVDVVDYGDITVAVSCAGCIHVFVDNATCYVVCYVVGVVVGVVVVVGCVIDVDGVDVVVGIVLCVVAGVGVRGFAYCYVMVAAGAAADATGSGICINGDVGVDSIVVVGVGVCVGVCVGTRMRCATRVVDYGVEC